MSLLRAFIAVEIPPKIHKEIENQTAPLRYELNASLVRWVPIENIHLTLKFLGDISPSNVEMLARILEAEASQHPSFEIQFRGLGVFPNPKRPRVLWIGIQAPAELEALHCGVEDALAKLGYPTEKRPFSPHLTIGRIKSNTDPVGIQKIRTMLEESKVGTLGSVPVTAIQLFKSELKPSGAIYKCLYSAPLRIRGDI